MWHNRTGVFLTLCTPEFSKKVVCRCEAKLELNEVPQKERGCILNHTSSKAAFSPEAEVWVKSNKADPAFYYNAQSRRASLRRASSITRNPPRIQLLRCNLPLLLSGEPEREEATKSLLFYPHSKVDPPGLGEREGRGVSLPLSFPSIRSQIDFKAASIIQRAGGHSTRKINKDRKGTNFSWMGYQYEGGCMARSLVHTSNKIGHK